MKFPLCPSEIDRPVCESDSRALWILQAAAACSAKKKKDTQIPRAEITNEKRVALQNELALDR